MLGFYEIRNQFNKTKEKLNDEEIEQIYGEQLELSKLERELDELRN